MIIHFTPTALFLGLTCDPRQEYIKKIRNPRQKPGRPKPARYKVRKLLWKRSLGLSIKQAAASCGLSEATARAISHKIGIPVDVVRSSPETRASAVAEYALGAGTTELAKKYNVGASSIFRWVREAGIETRNISEAKALQCASKPVGSQLIGKQGLFQSAKGCRWIPTDSIYEYARLEQLDDDDRVAMVQRCRDRIRFLFEGKWRTYVPDFRVDLIDGSVVVEEVKPSRWRNDPKVLAKEAAALSYYGNIGVAYRVVCEDEIGMDRIRACDIEVVGRRLPEYLATQRSRRLKQKRDAQRAYLARKKAATSRV